MNIIEQLNKEQYDALAAQRKHPEFTHGDTVKVWVKIREGDKERLQAYEGVVIARSGSGLMESFTVRKISYGEGVERVFPVLSPNIDRIEVLKRGRCAAPSSITCATGAASRPASSRTRVPAPRRSGLRARGGCRGRRARGRRSRRPRRSPPSSRPRKPPAAEAAAAATGTGRSEARRISRVAVT